ncbi:MAG TPA: TIGR00303 family protein, partial [Planktothrix sp. UBA8407]|nr:TIGR00303 family protein [Planktothrix sp. UBA8407]HBK23763.1 TIGR00303 family protein [Planktothrix sp. UBA10369]
LLPCSPCPLKLVAAVGDPMQIVVAGMTLAASRTVGVLLAGGTQMLAVYALASAIATQYQIPWCPDRVVVGTTRWVSEDGTGDTVGLAEMVGNVPLLATQLNFSTSSYPQLRAYEQGYVKEGVGAGGAAIAAYLALGWDNTQLLEAIEAVADRIKSNY